MKWINFFIYLIIYSFIVIGYLIYPAVKNQYDYVQKINSFCKKYGFDYATKNIKSNKIFCKFKGLNYSINQIKKQKKIITETNINGIDINTFNFGIQYV